MTGALPVDIVLSSPGNDQPQRRHEPEPGQAYEDDQERGDERHGNDGAAGPSARGPSCRSLAGSAWRLVGLLGACEEVSKEGHYWTVLHYASHYGHFKVLEFLV